MATSIGNLLLATDFQDESHAVLHWGSAIGRHHGARVVLFHAIPARAAPTDPRFPIPAPSHASLREAIVRKLGLQADLLAVDDAQLLVETRSGPAGAAILEAARRCRADLVVIGCSRLRGAARWLSDSVSAGVFENADRPVLAVHAEDSGTGAPIRNLLCVTDVAGPAGPLVQFGRDLLPGDRDPQVLWLCLANGRVEQDTARLLDKDGPPPRPGGARTETLVAAASPRRLIPELAESRQADLVAMGPTRSSRVWGLFRTSEAEAAAVRAPCPLLFWPEGAFAS